MHEDVKRLVGSTYAISFDLGNGRSIQVHGNIYADDTDADINEKYDRQMRLLERQRARAEIEVVELELKARRKRVEEMKFFITQTQAQIDAFDREVNEPTRRKTPADAGKRAQLVSALATHKLNLERMGPEIAEGERAVEEVKQKAA